MSDDENIDSDLDASNDDLNLEEDTMVSRGDSASTLADKEEERRRIQADIDAFLAGGGKINAIDKNVVADPPKKPESSYGSQPI